MNVYDDTPETEPRVQSMLPSKGAATRKIRSSKEYQNVRQQYLSGHNITATLTAPSVNVAGCASNRSTTG
jgi:hypothetical protein